MRLLGLLGGMSWESSAEYHRLLNQGVRARLGGSHSARLLLYSVDFDEVARAQHAGDWDRTAEILVDGARRLERGGAELALLCTNTMHMVLPRVQEAVGIPFVHVVDVTAAAIRGAGQARVGLLGTRFTMEHGFYHERLRGHGIDAVVPEAADRALVHRVIYDELCRGELRPESRAELVRIIRSLAERGAEGVVLGCTEIPLLVRPADSPLPVYDTTALHVEAGLDQALAPG